MPRKKAKVDSMSENESPNKDSAQVKGAAEQKNDEAPKEEMSYEDAMEAPAVEIPALVPSADDIKKMRQIIIAKQNDDFYKWDKPCEFSMLVEGISTTKTGIPMMAGWATFVENKKALPQKHIKITLPSGFVTQLKNKQVKRGDIVYVKHLGMQENKIHPENPIRSFVVDKLS